MKIVEYNGQAPSVLAGPRAHMIARVIEAQLELMQGQLKLLTAAGVDFLLAPAGTSLHIQSHPEPEP